MNDNRPACGAPAAGTTALSPDAPGRVTLHAGLRVAGWELTFSQEHGR
jgi:hypothetical protein